MNSDLLSVVPADPKQGYDMHDVVEGIVDKDSWLELKPFYDPSLMTGFARIDGHVAV